MRYTEYEFKLDHVFDFIRLIFSSVFLAPFRLVNEISKKIIYLDKLILEKVIIGAGITNGILILANVVNMIFTKQINLLDGSIPLLSELISLVGIGGLYYIVFIHQQPILKKVDKAKKIAKVEKEKEEHIIPDLEMEDENIISDESMDDVLSALETIEPIEVSEQTNKEVDTTEKIESVPKEKSEIDPILEHVDKALGKNFSDIVAEADTALFRDDEIEEAHRSCDKAVETDEFGIGDLINSMSNKGSDFTNIEDIDLSMLEMPDDDLSDLRFDDETPIQL